VTTEVFVGAGDIGWCGSPGTAATGRLLDNIGGTVFAAGDNAYMTGTAQEFRDCYDPYWGRVKGRTFAVPGNHEYEGAGPGPYFDYFGRNAGPVPGLGYYSFPVGSWHAIALNSNVDVSQGSGQGQWLRQDLEANQTKCTIAYWHHPLFSSGQNGDNPRMRDFWRMLYAAGVDVVVVGHDHLYERFGPQDPDGRPDRPRGIRQFIAGTGGALLYNFVTTKPNSEVRISAYGEQKLTLQPESYQWEFVPVSGQNDFGTDSCH
jgi:3',5'-cyclic AMP phosphodiesterase CpdA